MGATAALIGTGLLGGALFGRTGGARTPAVPPRPSLIPPGPAPGSTGKPPALHGGLVLTGPNGLAAQPPANGQKTLLGY